VPVLLWLHGGPGGAETPLFRLYNSALEQQYLVVYFDQRGAGQSYDREADPARLTVQQHLDDLDHVVQRLVEVIPSNKPVLLGHSWGAALGLMYAAKHADRVSAVVAVNPLISGIASQSEQLAFVQEHANSRKDEGVLAELKRIGPAPYTAGDVLTVQALVDRYGGVFHRKPSFLLASLKAVALGYVTPWGIPKYIEANNRSLNIMHGELSRLDLRDSVLEVGVPLIFMLGKYDRQISNSAASTFLEKVQAPHKSLIWFDSAHNIPFEEPGRFHEQLQSVLSAQIKQTRVGGEKE
jgi:pimeloyl-ACP methyl ester carboxylesterase